MAVHRRPLTMAVVLPDGLEGGNGSRGLFARVGEDPHPGSDSSAEVKSGDCGAGNECSARMGGARDRTHSRGFREAGLLVLVRLVGGPLAKVFIVVLGLAAWTLAAALDSGERQAEDLAEGRRRGGLETVLQTEGDVLLIDLGLGQGRRALTDGVVGEQPGEGGPMSQSVGRSISEPSLVLSGSPEREMISLHLFDLGGDDRFEVIFFFFEQRDSFDRCRFTLARHCSMQRGELDLRKQRAKELLFPEDLFKNHVVCPPSPLPPPKRQPFDLPACDHGCAGRFVAVGQLRCGR